MQSTKFSAIPIKLPVAFFRELVKKKKKPTIHMETQRPQITKSVLRKKNEAGGINLPNFSLYYKSTVIRTVWHWHKDKNITQ